MKVGVQRLKQGKRFSQTGEEQSLSFQRTKGKGERKGSGKLGRKGRKEEDIREPD